MLIVMQDSCTAARVSKTTGPATPTFGWRLTDSQDVDVLMHIRHTLCRAAPAVTAKDVSDLCENFA